MRKYLLAVLSVLSIAALPLVANAGEQWGKNHHRYKMTVVRFSTFPDGMSLYNCSITQDGKDYCSTAVVAKNKKDAKKQCYRKCFDNYDPQNPPGTSSGTPSTGKTTDTEDE